MADRPRHARRRRVLPDGGSPADLGLRAGSRYDRSSHRRARRWPRATVSEDGFLDVRVESETVLDQRSHTADVHVLAAPGPRSMLSSVIVEGARPEIRSIARSLNLPSACRSIPPPSTTAGAACTRPECIAASTSTLERPRLASPPSRAGRGRPPGRGARARRGASAIRLPLRSRGQQRRRLAPDEREHAVRLRRRSREPQSLRPRHDRRPLRAAAARSAGRRACSWAPIASSGCHCGSNVFLSRGREDIGSDGTIKTVSDVTEISARTDLPAAPLRRCALRLRSWPEPDDV